MKKISFLYLLLSFSTNCLSQNYVLIEHIGGSDRFIPALAIGNVKRNEIFFDSGSVYNRLPLLQCVIIELNKENYSNLKNIILKNKFVHSDMKSTGFGTFRIRIFKGKNKNDLYLTDLNSKDFFYYIIKKTKQKNLGVNLVLELEKMVKRL